MAEVEYLKVRYSTFVLYSAGIRSGKHNSTTIIISFIISRDNFLLTQSRLKKCSSCVLYPHFLYVPLILLFDIVLYSPESRRLTCYQTLKSLGRGILKKTHLSLSSGNIWESRQSSLSLIMVLSLIFLSFLKERQSHMALCLTRSNLQPAFGWTIRCLTFHRSTPSKIWFLLSVRVGIPTWFVRQREANWCLKFTWIEFILPVLSMMH